MTRVDGHFRQRVYEIVAAIPKGKVMTYGQVATAAGAAWASWEVGQIAHLAPCAGLPACPGVAGQPAGLTAHQAFSDSATPSKYSDTPQSVARQKKPDAPSARHGACSAHDLPWQRVVNKQGGLARGYPGGFDGHKKALEAEGVSVDEDYRIDIEGLLWQPPHKDQSSLL
ncbi:MAG: MGMT family protein [bacterium]|nr:MGMT family protein [bacterium]